MKEVKNLKVAKKAKLIALMLGITLCSASCGKRIDEIDTKEIVETYYSEEDSLVNVAESVEKVQKYIDLTEKISKLNLDEEVLNLDLIPTENTENFNYLEDTDKIEELIDILKEYKNKDDDIYKKAVNVLYYNNGLMNSYLKSSGYLIVETYMKATIKRKVIDSSDINFNYIEIMQNNGNNDGESYLVKYEDVDGNSSKIVIKSSDMHNLIDYLYVVQNASDVKSYVDDDLYGNASYNKDRNEVLDKAINLTNKVIPNDYETKDSSLLDFTSYDKLVNDGKLEKIKK